MASPYTIENLIEYNVLRAPNLDYVLVHRSHPVVVALDENESVLGGMCLTRDRTPVDGDWFKISKKTFGAICRRILSCSSLS